MLTNANVKNAYIYIHFKHFAEAFIQSDKLQSLNAIQYLSLSK